MQKTVLITGATSGIGKAAALTFASRHYHVIIHGRNFQKTEALRQEIVAASGNDQVNVVIADLYLQSDIRKMCAQIYEKFKKIDILINNAGGVMSKRREITAEGFEKTFALNVLAPFLITHLLMGLLVKSEDARIINVSSNSHQLNAKPDFNDLQLENGYNPLRAYGNAKLFLIWNTQQLVTRLQQKDIGNIKIYSMHPGAVSTGFAKGSDLGPVLNILSKLMRPFLRTPEVGADTITFLTTADVVPGKNGEYFVDRKPAKISTKYYTTEREQLVWDYCNLKTGVTIS